MHQKRDSLVVRVLKPDDFPSMRPKHLSLASNAFRIGKEMSFACLKYQSMSLKKALRLPQMRHSPTHEPINDDNCQHDTDPFASVSGTVPILLQYSLAVNLALGSQCALVHAMTPSAAVIGSVAEFVDHHASENVSLLRGVSLTYPGRKNEG